jgi:hypothetical protein
MKYIPNQYKNDSSVYYLNAAKLKGAFHLMVVAQHILQLFLD